MPLLARVWQLRHTMWPSDAAYVALGESLDAELITIDDKLTRTPGLCCTVRNLQV